jgi:hypothetical protein
MFSGRSENQKINRKMKIETKEEKEDERRG